ncbi:MAG: molybdenum cofactor guanylyltransferase [Halomonas subglaciescola]|nr:molybdenum cofactor guanylyltransferase [Halomonas subglaciescola]
MIPRNMLTGLVLAGGAGRRMGGRDKGLEPFAGRPMVAYVCARLSGRVSELWISANRHPDEYRRYADRVLADAPPPGMAQDSGAEHGYQGPLMGLYTGLSAAQTPWLVVLPCDTPALPDDVIERLAAAVDDDAEIVVAHDGERAHHVIALVRTGLAAPLGQAIERGVRSVKDFYAGHAVRYVNMADRAAGLANVNTAAERGRLEAMLEQEAAVCR